MGIRSKREKRAANGAGRAVGGGERGRKPLGRETVKEGREESSAEEVGMVVRMGKVGVGAVEPIALNWRS